tara:strand:+ start:5726 stop:7951 length:2226 start_codon:yes stop_codon:yes gene_type:complete
MADNTIDIIFGAKGDKDVIEAIKALDTSTKKLISTQASLAKTGKSQVRQHTQSQKAMMALDAKLRALGTSFAEARIDTNVLTKAYKGNKRAIAQVRLETQKHIKTLDRANRGILDTAHGTRILGGSLAVLRSKLLLASFAFASFSLTIGKVVRLYGEQEEAEKKLKQALKSTANAVKLSHKELTVMASGLQSVTKFGDEAIIEMQALMLTFTKIGKDVFPQAIESTLNISEAMGQDLKSSAIQVGKALNAPIEGVSALRRIGIQFTESQEDSIKKFVQTNDVASAQAVILKELEVQFGGMARAVRGTVIGSFTALSNSFGDMMEKLGENLAPFMKNLADSLSSITALMQTEGERQIAFLNSIGASEETLTKARIGLLKEEIQERLKSIGITDLDLNQRDELVGKYSQQEERLNVLKVRLLEQKAVLQQSSSALLDASGSSEAFNKALRRSSRTTEEVQLKTGKYAGTIAQVIRQSDDENTQLGIKVTSQKESVKQTQDQIDKQQAMTLALREYLIALDLVTETETINKESKKEMIEGALLAGQMLMQSFDGVTGAYKQQLSDREKADLASLKSTSAYTNASADEKIKMEKKVTDKLKDEKLRLWNLEKLSNLTGVAMNTASGVMKAYSQLGAYATPVALLIGGMGVIQAGIVASQKPPKFEQGGMIGGQRHSQGGTMIEAERGEFIMSRSAVQSVGVEALNQMNQGGGGGLTLNISAPLVDEAIIDTIIPAIQKAQRMNLA